MSPRIEGMRTSGGPFREFDDSHDADALRLARRAVRGLCLSVRHVVVAPGSRSAPLAYALAEAEQMGALSVHMRIDERSAAFTALGIAMSGGEPAAVVTTSGTAVGNLLPAVMEADLSGVPLVVITADRPEELHGTGANQTTWQQGMFAGRVRDEVHLEQGEVRLEPVSRDDILSAETQVALLMRQATDFRGGGPGPVHLNIGFCDPLVPAEEPEQPPTGRPGAVQQRWARTPVIAAERRRALYETASPTEHLRAESLLSGVDAPGQWADRQEQEAARAQIRTRLAAESQMPQRRTVFVLGDRAPAQAAEVAALLGHPLFAEPTSGARDVGVIPAYRVLLAAGDADREAGIREAGVQEAGADGDSGREPHGEQAAPGRGPSLCGALTGEIERVVVAGRPTLSRPVARLLARDDIDVRQFAPDPIPWADQRLPREILSTRDALEEFAGVAPPGWRERWTEAGRGLRHIIDEELAAEAPAQPAPDAPAPPASPPAEPTLLSVAVAKTVVETVGTPVLLGSSSVIRDVDLTADLTVGLSVDIAASTGSPADRTGSGGARAVPRLSAMRGLAGIDGNVSAASGMALAADRRVTAVVGDLTFLHDLNALLIPSTEPRPSVDVVVINDAGGAIFDQLEHGAVGRRPGYAQTVERLFGTPQQVDLQALAAGFDVEYRRPTSHEELIAALAYPDDRLGLRIIEVRTERRGLRKLHSRIAARARRL